MARDTAHPLPPAHVGEVNHLLGRAELTSLDDNARFQVRRLVADVYAAGFADGSFVATETAWADVRIEGSKRDRAEALGRQGDMADAFDAGWAALFQQLEQQKADPTHPITKNNPYRGDDSGARGVQEVDRG